VGELDGLIAEDDMEGLKEWLLEAEHAEHSEMLMLAGASCCSLGAALWVLE
jgi:hypothetical protein